MATSSNPWVHALRRLAGHKAAMISLVFLVLFTALCFSAGLVAQWLGVDPFEPDLFALYQEPGGNNILGTDELGRDVFVRLLYGGQVSISVGVVAALATAVVGSLIGVVAGYFGGKIDALLMRFADFMLALPILPLMILASAIDLTKLGIPDELARGDDISLYKIIIIVMLFYWPTTARLVRGSTLSMREREFVSAAVGYGAGSWRIMRRHILPNVIAPVIIATTMSIGSVILLESALSFLGLGIQQPMASWGNMLQNAREAIWNAPAIAIYPGIAILLTVLTFNMFGDGLQEALDPKSH